MTGRTLFRIFAGALLVIVASLAIAATSPRGNTFGGGGGFTRGLASTLFCALSGGTTCAMTGKVTFAAGDGGVLATAGDLVLDAPDGSVVIGPNKTTFTGAVADTTERCLIPVYTGQAGAALGGAIQTWAQVKYPQAVTVTAVTGRVVAGSATATAQWRIQDFSGQTCTCTHTCTDNGYFTAACVNGLGTGCVFDANAQITLLWAQDRDGGLDACSSAQPSLVNLCVLGKHQ